mmetsp:Transcript_19757/g.55156  ORF Transcript_19757/g.55156 Transcript_19757/m.55156 type:complete len:312 (+) Transcript_19757:436-1371(+)
MGLCPSGIGRQRPPETHHAFPHDAGRHWTLFLADPDDHSVSPGMEDHEDHRFWRSQNQLVPGPPPDFGTHLHWMRDPFLCVWAVVRAAQAIPIDRGLQHGSRIFRGRLCSGLFCLDGLENGTGTGFRGKRDPQKQSRVHGRGPPQLRHSELFADHCAHRLPVRVPSLACLQAVPDPLPSQRRSPWRETGLRRAQRLRRLPPSPRRLSVLVLLDGLLGRGRDCYSLPAEKERCVAATELRSQCGNHFAVGWRHGHRRQQRQGRQRQGQGQRAPVHTAFRKGAEFPRMVPHGIDGSGDRSNCDRLFPVCILRR